MTVQATLLQAMASLQTLSVGTKKASGLGSFALFACCLLLPACRTSHQQEHATILLQRNPTYELAEVPITSLKQEVYWHYGFPGALTRSFKERVERMTKEELLAWLTTMEGVHDEAYRDAIEEVAEIEAYLSKGAKVYLYSTMNENSVGEEGYIVLSPEGEVLTLTQL